MQAFALISRDETDSSRTSLLPYCWGGQAERSKEERVEEKAESEREPEESQLCPPGVGKLIHKATGEAGSSDSIR